MFRFNLTLSLILSVVLVGGAVWLKTANSKSRLADQGIESVGGRGFEIFEGSPRDIYLGERATSTQNLNQTDLLGRQLFSDYLTLSSKGQATPAKLTSLADSYAESILNLQSSTKIDRSKITITSNSQASLNAYGTAVVAMRIRYGDMVERRFKQSGITNFTDPKFSSFMTEVSEIYKLAASELQNLPVPQSLADNHVKLINNYLSSSDSARALASVGSDPLGAYAAVNTHAKNEQEESILLGNIQSTLAANGIIFPSGL